MNKRMIVVKTLAILVVIVTGCSAADTSADKSETAAPSGNESAAANASAPAAALQPVAFGQEKSPDAIYVIFDASGSMMGRLPDRSRKIETAKKVLQDFVSGDFEGYELALRVYGHRRKEDCSDSELLIPFGPADKVIAQLRSSIKQINATGRTPITYSLTEALKDFGDRAGEIILISDGIESCNADPCALVREWRSRNVKIRVHVVGLGLEEKDKGALRCISQAAGTEYHDANSASDLAGELAKIQQKAASQSFILKGADPAGNPIRVSGMLARDGREIYRVSSDGRNSVETGPYVLTAGVLTANGNLYKPVTQNVEVKETGETVVRVEVQVPPSVKAKFTDRDEQQRGSLITAFQNGREVFKFRWMDEVYLDEGSYEFRARPNVANDLSVKESFVAGDRKEIAFELTHTVEVTIKMLASGTGEWLRQNYELWQNGEKKYGVHMINGARVLPGTYEVRLPDRLTPYAKEGLIITGENKQHFDVTVPVGYVTVIYQKADGTRDKDDRCFMSKGTGNERIFKNGGKKLPLTPGTYNVTGWSQKGDYDRVVFDIKAGEDKTVVLRAKK
ncbi:MAG: VWA domain-containing protein [Blastocatellia bacterium]|nr:VWA domain-containing protein [Blastocatellia bacterium]